MATMLLSEKLEKGLIRVGDYIPNFQPDFKECILTRRETGCEKNQALHTEEGMNWQLVSIDGWMALVSDTITKQKIWLRGKIGAEKGVDALQKYSRTCWSAKKFHATGICMTTQQFKKLPCGIQSFVINERYWLGSSCVYHDSYDTFFGVKGVHLGLMFSDILYHLDGHTIMDNLGVRPMVILPSNIMIDDNNSLLPFDDVDGKKVSNIKAQLEAMMVKMSEQNEQMRKVLDEQDRKMEEIKKLISEL